MLPPPVAVVKTPFVKHIKKERIAPCKKHYVIQLDHIFVTGVSSYSSIFVKFIFIEQWMNNMQPQEQSKSQMKELTPKDTRSRSLQQNPRWLQSSALEQVLPTPDWWRSWQWHIMTSQHNFLPFQLLTMINPTVAIFRNHVHCYGQMLDYNLQRWKSKSLLQFGYVYPIS